MKRNRYLLCLLASCWLIYTAVPHLKVGIEGGEGLFFISWMILAIMVVAGNLIALVSKSEQQRNRPYSKRRFKSKKKVRFFHG